MTKEQSAVESSRVETEVKNEKKTRSPRKRQTKESAQKTSAVELADLGQGESEEKPAPKRKRTSKSAVQAEAAAESALADNEVKSSRARKTKSQADPEQAPKVKKPRTRTSRARATTSDEQNEAKPALAEEPVSQSTEDAPKTKASQTKKARSSQKTEEAVQEESQVSQTPQALEMSQPEKAEPKPRKSTRSRSAKKPTKTSQEPEGASAEQTVASLPEQFEKSAEQASVSESALTMQPETARHMPLTSQKAQTAAQAGFESASGQRPSGTQPLVELYAENIREEHPKPSLQTEPQAEAREMPLQEKPVEQGKENAQETSEHRAETGRISRRHHRGRRRPQSRLGVPYRQAETESKDVLSKEGEQALETTENRQLQQLPEEMPTPREDNHAEMSGVSSDADGYSDADFWDDETELSAGAEGKDAHSRRKDSQLQPRKVNRKMFFSVLAGERVEVAISAEGKLCEYYLDMQHQKKLKGNIYKGIIQNIDTNLQAAFVNYGTQKNGFLQIDEIHSEYWLSHYEPTKGNKFPPIQKVVKPGQEVLVQVVKEPTGNKGAFLTTWLSLAGRFLVLTPGQDQIGVSRKVVDEAERARLKDLINGIDPGEDIGVIVRTVSAGTTKTTLKNDLQYLKRIWRDIRKKGTEMEAPCLIYREPSLVERSVRDYLTEDVTEIWADDENVAETVRNMVNLLFPRKKDLVHLYVDKKQSIWDRFNLRRQIEQVYSREVFLPSGGRLVFDQTEALMAVDVNSGKISCKGSFETMAYRTNMEAAESIARQLRLRDVGGQVVIDFIEMRDKKHVEDVERNLRLAMKSDKARYDIEHMSSFGLLELVRQRTGFSALSITQEPCPYCSGTGQRRNLEWQSLQVASDIQRQMRLSKSQFCVYETSAELGMYLLNHKREMLQELEQEYGKKLEIAIHHNS